MKTLNLKEAAEFLNMSSESLRLKAKAGTIPGAKPGKSWTFLENDLAGYLRSLYSGPRQVPQGDERKVKICHSIGVEKHGGSVLRPLMDKEYVEALELKIERRPKSSTIN